jgi:hypothetical protein
MPDPWPVTIRTPEGDLVEVDFAPSGRVWIGTSSAGAWLSAAQREEFGRAYIAASWAAEGRVTSDG